VTDNLVREKLNMVHVHKSMMMKPNYPTTQTTNRQILRWKLYVQKIIWWWMGIN